MARLKTSHSRRLRKTSTHAENLLWTWVRGRRFRNLKFRRQTPIGPYIVDFACLKGRIILELDGGIHDAPFYDLAAQEVRDAWLRDQGFRVLRFRNSEIENTPNAVFERISAELRGG